jgi:hypothetical protein
MDSHSSVVARCTRIQPQSTEPHHLPDKTINYVNVVARRTRQTTTHMHIRPLVRMDL